MGHIVPRSPSSGLLSSKCHKNDTAIRFQALPEHACKLYEYRHTTRIVIRTRMNLSSLPCSYIGPTQPEMVVMSSYHDALPLTVRPMPRDDAQDVPHGHLAFWVAAPVFPNLEIAPLCITCRRKPGLSEFRCNEFRSLIEFLCAKSSPIHRVARKETYGLHHPFLGKNRWERDKRLSRGQLCHGGFRNGTVPERKKNRHR